MRDSKKVISDQSLDFVFVVTNALQGPFAPLAALNIVRQLRELLNRI
jgi:hypothetical protein